MLSIVLCSLLSTAVASALDRKQVKLSKIFHQTRSAHDVHKNIQAGGVTLVFSDDLVINQLPVTSSKKTRLCFFVPDGRLQLALTSMREIKSPQDNAYTVRISEVNTPKSGLQLDIEYDPDRVVFARDMFQRVTREHKLVFYFYDKQLLDTMKTKTEVPMIVHAALDPSVVIDCGHGGHDFGVIGCERIAEKNVCLAVGRKVAEGLKKKGIRVFLTRDSDTYVSLDNRIHEVNTINPCLLVSIHANASNDKNVSGIETFYFNRSLCSMQKKISNDTNSIGSAIDMHQKELTTKSKQLAQAMQEVVCKEVADSGAIQVVDRKVKAEPLQLLMGAMVPASLIEIGFLTNTQEAKLLLQDNYQLRVANGICKGIINSM